MLMFEMNKSSRATAILERLEWQPEVAVRQLAGEFGVSEMTVRRDLDQLERQRLVVRTHGGAVAAGRLRFLQLGLPAAEHSAAKSEIGRSAAGLVQPGHTIFIDTGTTPLEVARHLPQDRQITVVTTSLGVAQELYDTPIRVLILGGFLRREFPSVYGPITEKTLRDIRVDTLFAGCDAAISDDGFYSNDLHVSSLEQEMLRIASTVVVVTESAKFGRRAFARYARVEQVQVVVTDGLITTQDRENLESRQVQVILAGDKDRGKADSSLRSE